MKSWMAGPVGLVLGIVVQAGLSPSAFAQEVADPVHGQYLCGGIGDEGVQAMRDLRQAYNLRMKFAQARSGSYVAGVAVRVEARGAPSPARKAPVGPIEDCGPLLYLRLDPGQYRVSATYNGLTLYRNLRVGRLATEQVLYWPAK